MDVRVSGYTPPRGGLEIQAKLAALPAEANNDAAPWYVRVQFGLLHPFMDGNGRAGAAAMAVM